MPDTQISEEMVDIAARAVYAVSVQAIEPALGIPMCKFDELPERDLNLHRDYAKAALQAALSGHVVVPQSALDWLFGEGPDADGKWFGETIGDGIPKLAGRYPRTYWWRSKFRAMIQAAPGVSGHVVGWRTMDSAPKSKNILLFAVTDIAEDGEVKNWKMHSGAFHTGYGAWEWAGRILQPYDVQPTHWQPLPAPPVPEMEG